MDIKKIRAMFPYLANHPDDIYFDNSATTLKPISVINAEGEYLSSIGANPHTTDYSTAFTANEILDETREKVRKFINAKDKEEIVFTSGATFGLNQIAFGLSDEIQAGDVIFVSALEHSSDMLPWVVMAKQRKAIVKEIPLTDDLLIDVDKLVSLIDEKTKVVAFASVSNTVAAINDVEKIAKAIKAKNPNTIVSVDLAQSIAHLPTDVTKWDIDFASFSAHKMYGPFGVGVLYGKKPMLEKLKPLVYGGGMSETISINEMNWSLYPLPERLEAGTPNISGIYAFNKALDFVNEIGLENIQAHEKALKDYAIKRIHELDLEQDVEFYNLDNESPVLLFNVKGLNPQDISAYLAAEYHIDTRSGAHCARRIKDVINTKVAVRASFAVYNTEQEIETLLVALTKKDHFLDHLFK